MGKSNETGIVHLWDLPEEDIYVGLKESDRYFMARYLHKIFGEFHSKIAKALDTYGEMFSWFEHQVDYAVKLKFLKKICSTLIENGYTDYTLNKLEKNLEYVKAKGTASCIYHPKFPFDFNNESGGRIISAAFHDGSLSDRRFTYCNHITSLKKRIYQDVRNIFGDVIVKVNFDIARFPKIIYNVLVVGLGMSPGEKVLTDPSYPSFVFNSPSMWKGIFDQAISDDGFISNKSIGILITVDTTFGSKIPNILKQDKIIFEKLGFIINCCSLSKRYKVNIENKTLIREQWSLNFAGRENLLNASRMGILHPGKKKKLENHLNSYKQIQYKYGEDINKTLEACKNLHKENKLLTYSNVASSIKRCRWRSSEIMNKMVGKGLLKIISEYKNKSHPKVFGITEKGRSIK